MASNVALVPPSPLEVAREWTSPDRAKVGIIFLILTESVVFIMFVATYLIYIGKSLNPPYPKDVLEVPYLATVCLLSSSLTIVFAEHALAKNDLVGDYDSTCPGVFSDNCGRMAEVDL
jgi:cytochrome c oxidase subunit 3